MGAVERYIPQERQQPIQLPLSEIPLERNLSPELIHVAGHELNHALVAWSLGIGIDSISVIPEGNSLGRTVLNGSAALASLQIIAMAGSIETHDGTARGFGSDVATAAIIERYFDGSPLGFARARAAQEVFKYSTPVREKAAEIIAHLGVVSGSLLGQIMQRARLEVESEQQLSVTPSVIEAENHRSDEDKDESREKLIIDDRIQGTTIIQKVTDGKIVKEQTVCRVCGSINGHAEDCAAKQNKVESIVLPFKYIYG